jgi:hypothetical protein
MSDNGHPMEVRSPHGAHCVGAVAGEMLAHNFSRIFYSTVILPAARATRRAAGRRDDPFGGFSVRRPRARDRAAVLRRVDGGRRPEGKPDNADRWRARTPH